MVLVAARGWKKKGFTDAELLRVSCPMSMLKGKKEAAFRAGRKREKGRCVCLFGKGGADVGKMGEEKKERWSLQRCDSQGLNVR